MKRTRRQFLADAGRASASVAFFGLLGCESFDIDDPRDQTLALVTEESQWFFESGQGLSEAASPVTSRDDWELEILSGGTPITTVDFDEIAELARAGFARDVLMTMRCIKGTYVGPPTRSLVATGVFRGVPLRQVLEGKQISGEATKLRLFAEDGFTTSLSWDRVFDEVALPVLLAFELNGSALSVTRGGPVRLVIPEMWAYKSIKWLNGIDARTDFSTFGTFETGEFAGQSAVDNPALPALTSLIFRPDTQQTVQGPDVQVVGGALVGGGRIAAVQVTLDGGPVEVIETPTLDEVLESSGHLGLMIRRTEQYRRATEWPYPGIMVPFRIALRGLAPGPHNVTLAAVSTDGEVAPATASDPTVAGPRASLDFVVS